MKRIAAVYLLSVGLFVAAMTAVLRAGSSDLSLPSTAGRSLGKRLLDGLQDPISQVLLQLLLIVLVARAAGSLFRRMGQPSVVGEMFGGIALGPSLLGAVAPGFSNFVFAKSTLASLSTLSQFGILLFMFGVGMELDTKALRERARAAVLVSHVSILVPFALGATAALWLYGAYHGPQTTFLAFALFMGISMSITAFPVLARILQERALVNTPVGAVVLTSAAIDDVTAWCALAIIIALARAHHPAHAALTVLFAAIFVAVAILIVQPMLERLSKADEDEGEPRLGALILALMCAFTCSLVTETIGIHAFFGAFIAGTIIPKHPGFRKLLHERLYLIPSVVLVPIFFAFTGLRTQIGLLQTGADWGNCAAIFGLAVAGKFGGSLLAAKVTGLSWRESAGVGALMNTRGLVELIALNVGLDLGVLSPKIFAMLVLMALATTFMTGPVITLLKLGKVKPQAA